MPGDSRPRPRVIDLSDITPAARGEEHRREKRMPANLQASLIMLADGEQGERVAVTVLNCSLHGIGFRCEREFSRNAEFLLPLEMEPNETALFRYIVRHCRPDGAGFLVGAEFQEVAASTRFLGSQDQILRAILPRQETPA